MPSAQPSTTDLLVAALDPLGLKNTRGATKLDKVLSGFNRLADAIGDMRNEAGPVAHGKDGFLDAIAADHARAFLHAGDAILGILLNAFEGKQPDLIATPAARYALAAATVCYGLIGIPVLRHAERRGSRHQVSVTIGALGVLGAATTIATRGYAAMIVME